MRSENYGGLLGRLLDQKARAVNRTDDKQDNPKMDVYKDVDRLRETDNIPLGTQCLTSLLNKQNTLK